MDKSLLVFIAVGIGFFYMVTNYVGKIQHEDDSFQNSAYQQEHKYDQYYAEDTIGQAIIDASYADPEILLDIWDKSPLKPEFLELFPDFDTMKSFVRHRVRGEALINRLLVKINEIEDKFFSGKMNAEQAKRALENIR